MIAALLALVGGKRILWIAAAVALAAGVGYVLVLRTANANLRAEVIEAQADAAAYQQANQRNVERFKNYIDHAERSFEALAAEADRANARAADFARLQEELDNVPTRTDCPVAPVLDHALDGLQHLRDRQTAGD